MKSSALKLPGLGILTLLLTFTAANKLVLGQCELSKFSNSETTDYDQLGYAVAIDGTTALAGAHSATEQIFSSGAAYIYSEGTEGWNLTATLLASDALSYDLFGISVDLQGDVAVVGAVSTDGAEADTGAVYVYRFDGSSWNEEAKLWASDGTDGSGFGFSVAIDGDSLVVGSYSANSQAENTGAVYVFRFDGSSWIEEEKISASDSQAGDRFGYAVSISNGWILVGAPWKNDNGQESGAAYLYQFNGTDWSSETKIATSDSGAGDFLGYSVDIDDPGLVIGAVEFCICSIPPDPSGSGAAYVFRRNGVTWTEEVKLQPSDGQLEQWFGASSSISSGTIIIGAHDSDVAGLRAGSAYLFRNTGIEWIAAGVLLASDADIYNAFGQAVSVRGDLAIVGAPQHNDGGASTGSIYVFAVGPSGCESNFIRGDCNGDGLTNIADPIQILGTLFAVPGIATGMNCRDACDSNDDGMLDISDAIVSLQALFALPTTPLPAPTICGPDPTTDNLTCLQYPFCP